MIDQFVDTVAHLSEAGGQIAASFMRMREEVYSAERLLIDVDTIIAQTDLLSLDAARAGEAGRGFAVVAEEVGNLVRRTTDFSAQVKGTLVNVETSITTIDSAVKLVVSTDLTIASKVKSQVLEMWKNLESLNVKALQQSHEI